MLSGPDVGPIAQRPAPRPPLAARAAWLTCATPMLLGEAHQGPKETGGEQPSLLAPGAGCLSKPSLQWRPISPHPGAHRDDLHRLPALPCPLPLLLQASGDLFPKKLFAFKSQPPGLLLPKAGGSLRASRAPSHAPCFGDKTRPSPAGAHCSQHFAETFCASCPAGKVEAPSFTFRGRSRSTGRPPSLRVRVARLQEPGCPETVPPPDVSRVLLSAHRPSPVFIVSHSKSFLEAAGGINK